MIFDLLKKSVMGCCEKLLKELEPIKKLMPLNYSWKELIDKAFSLNCNLSAMYLHVLNFFKQIINQFLTFWAFLRKLNWV